MDDNYQLDIASEWDSTQWVYVYMFSDAATLTNGFGAFVAGVGAEFF